MAPAVEMKQSMKAFELELDHRKVNLALCRIKMYRRYTEKADRSDRNKIEARGTFSLASGVLKLRHLPRYTNVPGQAGQSHNDHEAILPKSYDYVVLIVDSVYHHLGEQRFEL